jgi:hypothetical protein
MCVVRVYPPDARTGDDDVDGDGGDGFDEADEDGDGPGRSSVSSRCSSVFWDKADLEMIDGYNEDDLFASPLASPVGSEKEPNETDSSSGLFFWNK